MEKTKEKNRTICFYDLESTSVSRDADPISVGLVAITYQNEHLHSADLTKRFNQKEITLSGIIDEEPPIISIKTFYAEFDDFNINKADDWVKENIIPNLEYNHLPSTSIKDKSHWYCMGNKGEIPSTNVNFRFKGNSKEISKKLKEWLSQFEEAHFWADFDVIDKPMLIDLIADWDYYMEENSSMLLSNPPQKHYSPKHKIGLPKHLSNIKYYNFFDLHTLFQIKGIDPDINREEFAEDTEFEGDKHNALYDAYVNWKCYDKLMKL